MNKITLNDLYNMGDVLAGKIEEVRNEIPNVPSDYQELVDDVDDLKSAITEYSNQFANIQNVPRESAFNHSNASATVFNTSTADSTMFTSWQTGKYYLSFAEVLLKDTDTVNSGFLRLNNYCKNTGSTEVGTIVKQKNIQYSTAEKGKSHFAWNICTVSSDESAYYKMVSYNTGTTSKRYDETLQKVGCFEFDDLDSAVYFAENLLPFVTQDGFITANDNLVKTLLANVAQIPYTGKTCCVIGDSLSSSYYDVWCSYFANKTNITLTNNSAGGTSVAVRSGRTDSFVERIQSITDEFDLWIVFGGMNDKDGVPIGTETDTSTSTFYGALNTIIQNIQLRSNHPQLIFITPYHNVDSVMPYVEAIRTAAENYGVPIVDLAKISGVNPTTRSIYTRDSTHPNQLLCDRLRPQITRELVEKIVFPEKTDAMPN